MGAAVRLAEPTDSAFLAGAWRAMALECGIAPQGFTSHWFEQLSVCLRAGIEDGSQGWFVAAADGVSIGSAAAFLRISAFAEVAYRRPAVLAGVYVAPAFRRQGIARELTVQAIAWARERGCTHLSLRASAAAERLYRALGFEDESEMVLKLK